MNDFGNIDPDLQLFEAVRKSDRNAFEQLFQKYYTDLCHYAWTYLDEKSETEDAVQDVFIYIWNNRETIRLQESFRGYLFSAVKHRVLNILKHQLVERTHSRLLSEYWDDLLKSGYSEEEQTQLEQIQPSIFTPAMPYCVYEKLSGREKIPGDSRGAPHIGEYGEITYLQSLS